jgi:hypothetical protein
MINFSEFSKTFVLHNKSKNLLVISSFFFCMVENTVYAAPRSFPESLQQSPSSQLLAQSSFRYRVFVNGNSQLLLEQVQKIEPKAFTREDGGRDVIQAGAFNNIEDARQRVQELENIGLQARIQENSVRVSSYNTNLANDQFGYDSSGYFVVIPAPERDLKYIEQQVRRLALREDLRDIGIQRRDQPRGWHVIVGPFIDREIAERWNRYLKDFGLSNSRVYYEN